MNNYYSNFKRYDKRDNRLAIFGREENGKELEIFILKCNKNDNFNKHLAKHVYAWFLEKEPIKTYHPEILHITIKEGNTAKWTFDNFCELYYTKKTQKLETFGQISYEYLKCGKKVIILKNTLKFVK